MRKLTIALLALILLVPASLVGAKQEEVRIASGRLGGTYRDVYGPNLGKLLHGYKVRQLNTSGSVDNLDRLADGRADIAFAQADVFAARADHYADLVVLGKISDECLYVAARKAGAVKGFEQLGGPVEGRAPRVAVGSPESGAAGTWRYLSTLVPGLADAEIQHEEGPLALNRLAVGASDAVLWVTDPTNYDHYSLRTVQANDALVLLPLNDPALVTTMPDGMQIYQPREVKLTGSWRGPKLATICTSALVFARRDASPKLIDKVSSAIGLELDKIVPKNP